MDQFLQLSTQEISNIYTSIKGGNTTLVFAYDGTRRSYLISEGLKNLNAESAGGASTTNCAGSSNSNSNKCSSNSIVNINKEIKIDYLEYSKTAIHKFLNLSITMFQHGIKTIVYPMWFCTLEKRGPEYLPKFIQYLWGLSALLEDPNLVQQYKECGIKVVFYGEYQKLLTRGGDNALLDKFEKIMELTKNNTKKLLLLGTNIEEPSQTIINCTLSYFKKFGKEPTKQDLIESYYGDSSIQDVSFYIGFDRFSTDGRPILISENGDEDLYYAVSPHSYFTTEHFRKVLYDHLYQRSCVNAKEYELKISDVEMMKSFYDSNAGKIMGVGEIQKQGNYWYPSPQVVLIDSSSKDLSSITIESSTVTTATSIATTTTTTSHVSNIKQKLLNNKINSTSKNNNNHLNLITKSIKKIELNNHINIHNNNNNNNSKSNNNTNINHNSNNSNNSNNINTLNSNNNNNSNEIKNENQDNIISYQSSPIINSLMFSVQNTQMGSPPSPRYLNSYI